MALTKISINNQHKNEENVLIIEENVEFLEYSETGNTIVNLEHIFYEIHNLAKNISLKEHQKEGVAWLQSLFEKGYPGGLLADDMGLGKTLQILYFIEWHSQ